MAEPSNGRGALAAGGLAAILASTCCLGPLVLITLGFSGAWIGNLTALEPYRPIFIGGTRDAMVSKNLGPIDGHWRHTRRDGLEDARFDRWSLRAPRIVLAAVARSCAAVRPCNRNGQARTCEMNERARPKRTG